MAAMAMARKPSMKNEVQSFSERRRIWTSVSNIHNSLKDDPRSLKLGWIFAGASRSFVCSRTMLLEKLELQIGTIAVFLHIPNRHIFFTLMGII
jgi:hypothetical protein